MDDTFKTQVNAVETEGKQRFAELFNPPHRHLNELFAPLPDFGRHIWHRELRGIEPQPA
jgi:hypothetical protein